MSRSRRAAQLARLVNDALAEARRQHPAGSRRWRHYRTNPRASATELERGDLGLRGAMLFANVNGEPIHGRKWPIYETAARLDVPLMIHPTTPPGEAAYASTGYAADRLPGGLTQPSLT
jgi:predicted TIM-barrel fold metal-dependent hydrolase